MQDFVKAERVTLQTVRDLSELHSEIMILQLSLGTGWAYEKYNNKVETLQIYCFNNSEVIVKVFPSLKEPMADFLCDNPFDGSIDVEWEDAVDFEREQNEAFLGHLYNALRQL